MAKKAFPYRGLAGTVPRCVFILAAVSFLRVVKAAPRFSKEERKSLRKDIVGSAGILNV